MVTSRARYLLLHAIVLNAILRPSLCHLLLRADMRYGAFTYTWCGSHHLAEEAAINTPSADVSLSGWRRGYRRGWVACKVIYCGTKSRLVRHAPEKNSKALHPLRRIWPSYRSSVDPSRGGRRD